ncbi:mediator of RNA polymerase II transcription subunit 28-like [Haliotis rubra]|uniref:mediator of RNA polymerase II transcription subunit 28-like n=1 Tax=Haliotis rubra TaxID=36100 RepID=UPI001EE5041F|nr:mediator of RNA polymerase II transcription subunit 28-like [Haliotis rubra]
MAASTSDGGQSHIIDDLETAFQNCLALVTTQEHFNVVDSEETKTGVDHTISKFLDLARQTEAYFLSQRLIMSTEKPEQVLKEDIADLKSEIERKEKLIEKHHERLQHWQNLLRNMPGTGTPQQPSLHQQQPPQMQQPPPPQPMHPQQHPGMAPYPGPPMPGTVPQPFVMPPPQPPPAYQPGPLAYLEQTMSNIGMPDRR